MEHKESKNQKIAVTLVVMIILIILSGAISWMVSSTEEQTCWDVLNQSVDQVAKEMENSILRDQEFMESVASIISEQDSLDSPEVWKIINNISPNIMATSIGMLLPGDIVMLPRNRVYDSTGKISFEEEAAQGKHVSNRTVSMGDKQTPIVRNFVPVIKDGETIAMLYGTINLDTLPERWQVYAYEGKAAVYVVDGENGDILMDTWHKTLGNILDIGNGGRKTKRGYSYDTLQQDLYEGKEGHCVFLSESSGSMLYFAYKPTSINKWEVAISIDEKTAFAAANKINNMLIAFLFVEIILLGGYFVWILRSVKKELRQKQREAETDALTGLLNRNCYEKSLYGYKNKCAQSLTCIYADANGLHELNNTRGHEAGDILLRSVAGEIQKKFGVRDTYRIGGDEFVAFAVDEDMLNIRSKIDSINNELTAKGYHASIGICRSVLPIDIDYVIKCAERNMYDEKKRYYAQSGNDRRGRFHTY